MEIIRESLPTPVAGEYDIIVVGGGPSGVGASLSAARSGAKTLLIEKENCLGGMWTSGFMNPLFDSEEKTGIISELIDELKKENQWGGFWGISFNYEYMKRILDQKAKEAGVDVLFNTSFSRALVDGNTVRGVVVENIEGRKAYFAKCVIDCTGDGCVAANAGCAFEIGVDGDVTACQPMTLMFLVGNIPEKYKDGLLIRDIVDECYEMAGIEAPFHMPYLIPAPNAKFGVIQFTHMYDYNPLSEKSVSEATIEGRRQMFELVDLLKRYNDDFKDLELIVSAGVLGIRESRRIIGDYMLTTEDVLESENGYTAPDGICKVRFNMDMHTKSNKGQNCRQPKPFEVPFRCLIPKDYNGILVAGRCISGSHEVMAAYRVTGNCCQMGEAAGTVAAYCAKTGKSVRDVSIKAVLPKAFLP